MNIVAKSNTINCPKCKKSSIETKHYQDTVDFRGIEFDVDNLQISKCQSCGYSWESEEQIRVNQELIKATYATHRDNLRKKQGLLSGEEIAEIRNYFKLNQRQASVIFGGGFNAFNKYESGEVLQSVAMDRLLKLTFFFKKQAIIALNTISNNKGLKLENLVETCKADVRTAFSSESLRVSPPRSNLDTSLLEATIIEGIKINASNNFGVDPPLNRKTNNEKLSTTFFNLGN